MSDVVWVLFTHDRQGRVEIYLCDEHGALDQERAKQWADRLNADAAASGVRALARPAWRLPPLPAPA